MRLTPWGGRGWWLGALALVGALAVVGCGGGGGRGTVSGKVTYKGTALKGGRVIYSSATGANTAADIGEDGTYTAQLVPTGPAKISVQTSYLQMARARGYAPPKDQKAPEGYQMGGDPNMAKRFVKIPDQYENADTSGLTYDVKRGDQKHDLELK